MTARLGPQQRPEVQRDLVLALGVAALMILGSDVALQDELWAALPHLSGPLIPHPRELCLILAGTLPLTFRRLAPVPVLTVCVVASLALQAVGQQSPLPLGVLVALYSVAVVRRPLVWGIAVAAYFACLVVGTVTGWAPLSDDLIYTYVVAIGGSVMLGSGVSLGRARARLAEEHAAVVAREHQARTEAAVKQEQARIARDMHDMVTNDVSVMVAQATAARRQLPAEAATAQSLAAIEGLGRDALDGLRRLVGLLRVHAESDPAPPGLDRLPWLLAQVRGAGLPVELTVRGRSFRLPAAVDENAYRIVQEALTNALKHAGPTPTEVRLDYEDDALLIEISDRGPSGPVDGGPPPKDGAISSGYGLISMQQRAAMLGGVLTAGANDGAGFRVSARLPVSGGTR
jgi:signal transduction histidine kinase